MNIEFDKAGIELLSSCTLCPRECNVNRFTGREGYCGTDSGLNISSICIHRGEEPPVSGTRGICNIFFSGCNLRCVYCQNHEISRPGSHIPNKLDDLNSALDAIEEILSVGVKAVGFVSPSHVVPQVKTIIRGLHKRGLKPVTVYNTNGYDRAGILREIAGLIDVYLPDLKYASPEIAFKYSGAADYPSVAVKALKEMYYQKGSALQLDEDGSVLNGFLIRHLVLPGHSDESIKVLRLIADELSTGVNLSLMSQYHPVDLVRDHPVINRSLHVEEYQKVVDEMNLLGFRNGWLQDPESTSNYLPDFSRDHPFESQNNFT